MRRANLLPGGLVLAFASIVAAGQAEADAGPRLLSPTDLQGFAIRAGDRDAVPPRPAPMPLRTPAFEPAVVDIRPRARPVLLVPEPRPARLVPLARPEPAYSGQATTGPRPLDAERLGAVALKSAVAQPDATPSVEPAQRRAVAVERTPTPAPAAAPAGQPRQLDPDALVAVGLGMRGRPGGKAP